MKKYDEYRQGAPTEEREKLPPGGYVLEILDAEEIHYKRRNVLLISFDIYEGKYKGFFSQSYAGQQEPKKWKGTRSLAVPADDDDDGKKDFFANQIACIEASNPGFVFNFDENSLKGKLVGAVFGAREYDSNGRRGFFTTCRGFRTADAIREGRFNLPRPLLLKTQRGASPASSVDGDTLPL